MRVICSNSDRQAAAGGALIFSVDEVAMLMFDMIVGLRLAVSSKRCLVHGLSKGPARNPAQIGRYLAGGIPR